MESTKDSRLQASRPADAKINSTGVDPDQALVNWILAAEVTTDPYLANARVIEAFAKGAGGSVDYASVVVALVGAFGRIQGGDMSQVESMLFAQSVALQSLFVRLLQQSMGTNCVPSCNESRVALALKCQAQCCTTLKTLAEIRFPKSPLFFKQANIAQQQLVNQRPARARRKKRGKPNELQKEDSRATLDTNRTSGAGDIDSRLAAVDAIHRPAN